MITLTSQDNENSDSDADSIIDVPYEGRDGRGSAQEQDQGTFVDRLGKLEPDGFGRIDRELIIAVLSVQGGYISCRQAS